MHRYSTSRAVSLARKALGNSPHPHPPSLLEVVPLRKGGWNSEKSDAEDQIPHPESTAASFEGDLPPIPKQRIRKPISSDQADDGDDRNLDISERLAAKLSHLKRWDNLPWGKIGEAIHNTGSNLKTPLEQIVATGYPVFKEQGFDSDLNKLAVVPLPVTPPASKRQKSSSRGKTAPVDKDHSSAIKGSKGGDASRKGGPPHFVRTKQETHGILQPGEESILQDVEQLEPPPPVAELAHGLDRVLFNPGVHWLQDPRSRVYNFTPWLQSIPKVSDFDFNRIPGFVPSSRDNDLFALAKRQGRRFAGSTSSLTGILSQCYFLISGEKDVDTSTLSSEFQRKSKQFTPAQRWPASVKMNYREGIYTIDSLKSELDYPEKNILLWLGTILEKFLTVSPAEFSKLLQHTPLPEATLQELRAEREAYRYAQSSEFVMRSQLDCYDSRLPGTGVFDIKTRACTPTRLDVLNYEEHTGYTIKTQHGALESFEKEYYDLIRSAFLKYGFQARIGNMDGVIVAYHNTERMFGFQYCPLEEMDERLFGPGEGVGEKVFEKCVGLMEQISAEVSCTATFYTKQGTDAMYVWVSPEEWNGNEGERPVEQLRVEVKSYIGEDPVPGHRAVSDCLNPDAPWTMEYKIQRLDVAPAKARRDLEKVKGEMFLAKIVPSGIDEDAFEEYWQTLAHGNATERHSMTEFNPDHFQFAVPGFIEKLRVVSRKGRRDLDEMEERYKDEPKVVLGQSVDATVD
ncbi:hypothetical protein D9611_008756 [Ephemerocybe angulata]|uniref:Pet127-domain-containing protein n=1 Tax=Ephemerocybe angulata TaxID=980116 RepID=A0A8H5FIY8_9AGAR|nr:hypothetical protein D9611_008756 [Tulosesus angulatus]